MQGKELLDRLEELRQRKKDSERYEELCLMQSKDEDETQEMEDLEGTDPLDEDEAEELSDLEDAEGYLDRHSELIEEKDFKAYARDMADALGQDCNTWPYTCIDWEKAAHELSADYTTIEIGGTSYYVRD